MGKANSEGYMTIVLAAASIQLALPEFRNALIGHIVLFVGRLSFIFSSAIFGFAFLARPA